MGHTFKPDQHGSSAASEALAAMLGRLDGLIDWERRDRGRRPRMRQSLEPVRDLLQRLGSPERSFRCIHVAGTKGKGSVASLIEVGLRLSGARVGVYASPHVESIRERVRIDGRNIEEAALAQALERALDAHASSGPGGEATWFDVLTAAAFVALAEAGVEWAVVECGLGGRLDSTNALCAEVAVLTNVDLEHTAILGKTRAAIAREKAGIIEPGSVVISGVGRPGDEAADVVAEVAREKGARLVRGELDADAPIEEQNAELAGLALEAVGLDRALLDDAARAAARLPGRLEQRVLEGIPVVLDGAHVPASLERVLRDLARDPALSGPPVVVLGLGRDKDSLGLLKVLVGGVDRVICTALPAGPVLSPQALCDEARRVGLEAEAVAGPQTALEMALRIAKPAHWILVTGSLHLLGEVRGSTSERKLGC